MKKIKQLETKHILLMMTLLVTFFIAPEMDAQTENSHLSIQLSRDITGSGLGGNVCPSIALTYKKSTYNIGPNFQRKRMNFSGVQANYRYSVAKNLTGKREVFVSGNFTFHNSARICDSYIEIEKSSNSENLVDYDAMRLTVVESYLGLGFKINPVKQFSTFFSVGMGAFNTMNKNYDREMFREKASVAMRFNFSVVYNIQSNGNKVIL